MRKIVFYLMLMVASFSLSSFGISDNPKATLVVQNNARTPSVAPKSNFKSSISLLADNEMVDKNKEDEKTKSFFAKLFSFVFASITKLIFGLVS